MQDPAEQSDFAQTRKRLLLCIAIFFNLLVVVTWRLWLPPTTSDWSATSCTFPRVPLISALRNAPLSVDYLFLGAALLASWAVPFLSKRLERVAILAFVVGAAGLIPMNQHRLQPWLYQFLLLYVTAAFLSHGSFLRFARWLLISVYLFSAWSKLDYTFTHSLGQQFIESIFSPLGGAGSLLTESQRAWAALIFPITEIVIALGLAWRTSRRQAAYLAIAFHIALITVLSPLGMNHHWGVMIWNAGFAAMIWLLFVGSEQTTSSARNWEWYLSAIVIALPLLEPFGLIDHWPAWQLYAPRNSRVALQLASPTDEQLQRIPAPLREFLHGNPNSPYHYVDLDAWSLADLNAPIYPQDRFQLGVALAVARRCDLGDSAIVVVESVADRVTGERKQKRLQGFKDIEVAVEQYRFNAYPE